MLLAHRRVPAMDLPPLMMVMVRAAGWVGTAAWAAARLEAAVRVAARIEGAAAASLLFSCSSSFSGLVQ